MSASITAEDIREIRGMYELTQKAFAQVIGIGEASIVRYERGAEPSKANANLIRAARHPEFMKECLEREGDNIPQAQRDNAMRIVYALVSLDPCDEEAGTATSISPSRSKMDEMYHYTIQQEVLNEQAANIIAEIISIKLARGFIGDAGDVFESLLNQLAALKPTIVSSETMSDEKLSSIRGYLQCADRLLDRQRSVA